MLANVGRPRLVEELKLMHPDHSDIYFAYKSGGEYYELNEVAYRMLGYMDGETDLDAICAAIQREFEGAEQVRHDLGCLLEQLVSEGLVTFVGLNV